MEMGGGGGENERTVDLQFISYYCYDLQTSHGFYFR